MEVKEFFSWGSILTKDGRSEVDIKSRITQARKSFTKNRSLLKANIRKI